MSGDSLARVSTLARIQTALESEVAQAEKHLVELKKQLASVCEVDLPELLRELELKDVSLIDGSKVSFKDDYRASVPTENMDAAIAWLIKQKADGIVKTVVTISYDRGEYKQAAKDAKAITKLLSTKEKQRIAIVDFDIHAQTLGAFVRERAAIPAMPPEDIFKIYPFSKSKVTSPRSAPAARVANRRNSDAD